MSHVPRIISIDGPAAAGKNSVGRELAKRLRYLFVDTGVFYRAVTWAALKLGLDVQDEQKLVDLALSVKIELMFPPDPEKEETRVLMDGEDVTRAIRTPEVDANVAHVAAIPGVRAALTPQKRRIVAEQPVVMVGRDIGTVVLPDADLKIWLDASLEQRAKRRYEELSQLGHKVSFSQVLRDMTLRDTIDGGRETAPMRIPAGAMIIDTDNLSVQQVVDIIMAGFDRQGI